MKIRMKKEVKIGLTVIGALAIFVWGINYLKGVNLLNPTNHYFVTYNRIDGLVKSSPVNLDGFQVGLVRDIRYQYNNPGHIVVDLDLDPDLKLPAGTTAYIQSEMVGNPVVTLVLGKSASIHESGDTLLGGRIPGLVDQLTEGILADVQHMVRRTDSLLTSVETLINNGNIEHSLQSIEKTSSELSQISVKLNKSMNKLPGILDNVDHMTEEFTLAGKKVNAIDVASLNNTLHKLESITVQLNSKDNSMGLLLNDRALYDNLNTTTFNLGNAASSANALMLDLKSSPKRYVHFSLFGSKQSK